MKRTIVNAMAVGFILLLGAILTGAAELESTNNITFENQQKYKVVSGVIRNTGNGWEIINDSGHEPLHVKAVSNNNIAITIEHSFKAKQVVSFVVTPDETFVKEGLMPGASVGLDKSYIYLSKMGSNVYTDPSTVVNSRGNFWFYGIFETE